MACPIKAAYIILTGSELEVSASRHRATGKPACWEQPLPSAQLKGSYRRAHPQLPLLLAQPLPLGLAHVDVAQQAAVPDD